MKKWLWLTTLSIVLIGFFTLMEMGSSYLGKSYLDTTDFNNEYDIFTDRLIAFELDPPSADPDEPVTQEEIEEYRTRNGSLTNQISSIQEQYDPDIEAAEENGNDTLAELLTEERDQKMEEIRSNFSDDEVVREKVQAERESAMAQIVREMQSEKAAFFEESGYYVYQLGNTETGETFTKGKLKNNPYFEEKYTAGKPLTDADGIYYTSASMHTAVPSLPVSDAEFTGTIQIDRDLLAASSLGSGLEQFTRIRTVLCILGALAIAGTVLLLVKFPFKWQWFTKMPLYEKWKNIPLEIRLAALFLTALFALVYGVGRFHTMLQYLWSSNALQYGIELAWQFAVALFLLVLALLQAVWLFAAYQNREVFWKEVKSGATFNYVVSAREAFLKKSITFQLLLSLVVVFFWGAGTVLLFVVPQILIVWIPCTLFIGIPVLLFIMNRFGYLNVLMQRTENLASGQLDSEIPVRGKSHLTSHAQNLNLLKEGVRQSMSEQAKSERLKTELITNVSHDLRTPLTSIITYTDLMKSPELSAENRLAYADILDRKSQRLKTLIEDLFEVSKMASGNMELNRQRVDFIQLMMQALAEHEEEIAASGLDFRVTVPEEPVYIFVDGQKWWRVLDNLIINAIKYALPGTRVYLSLRETDGQAEFVMKNVTRYELGENTDELFERFKRGDTSRQTEGSGLGLAIAQSIAELHDGALKIEVDGDLFKVILTVNKA